MHLDNHSVKFLKGSVGGARRTTTWLEAGQPLDLPERGGKYEEKP